MSTTDRVKQGIIVNDDKQRFELVIKGHTSFVNFSESDGVVSLLHVEVPITLRNQGFGAGLMQSVMEHLKNADKKVKPVCSFAKSFIENHPEWQEYTV